MAKLEDFNDDLDDNTIGEIINSTPSSVEQTRSTRIFVWNWLQTRTTRRKWTRWSRPSRTSRTHRTTSTSTRRTRKPTITEPTTTEPTTTKPATTQAPPVSQSEEYEVYVEEYSYPVGDSEYYENEPIEYYDTYDEVLTKDVNLTKPDLLSLNSTKSNLISK